MKLLLLLLFWSIIVLMIVIAYKTLPKPITQRIIKRNGNIYYGVAGLVREGMNTLRKTTMQDYPYGYATHPPTGQAKNNAISNYYKTLDYNKTIFTNNNYLVGSGPQIQAFNECN